MKHWDTDRLSWKELLEHLDPLHASSDQSCGGSMEDKAAEAWAEAYARLLIIAKSIPDAEEAASRIFERLVRPKSSDLLQRVLKADNPEGYLREVIRNEARGESRQFTKHSTLDENFPVRDDRAEMRALVQDIVSNLVQKYKRVLKGRLPGSSDFELLREKYEGKSIRELASEQGMKYEAMAQRLHRAVKRYEKHLRPFFKDIDIDIDAKNAQWIVAAIDQAIREIEIG